MRGKALSSSRAQMENKIGVDGFLQYLTFFAMFSMSTLCNAKWVKFGWKGT